MPAREPAGRARPTTAESLFACRGECAAGAARQLVSTHEDAIDRQTRTIRFLAGASVAFCSACLQRGHRRQLLAFEEFQERAAAGGDVGHACRRCRTCPPPPACRRRRRSRRRSESAIARASVSVPLPKASNSNTPTGPFHTTVPACGDALGVVPARSADRCPGSSRRSCTWSTASPWPARGRERRRHHHVDRHRHLGAAALASAITCAWPLDQVGLHSEVPTRWPAAAMKVLAMPPPTISWSTRSTRFSSRVSLVETLEPATIASSGRRRLLQRLAQRIQFGRQQRAGRGHRREADHAVGGGLGAVRGAEGIHHEDVAQCGVLLRQRLVVVPSRRRSCGSSPAAPPRPRRTSTPSR